MLLEKKECNNYGTVIMKINNANFVKQLVYFWKCCRGVSRILSNVYDQAFFESSEQLSAVNCLSKKISSYIGQIFKVFKNGLSKIYERF